MAQKAQISLPESTWTTTADIHMEVVIGLRHSSFGPCRMEGKAHRGLKLKMDGVSI